MMIEKRIPLIHDFEIFDIPRSLLGRFVSVKNLHPRVISKSCKKTINLNYVVSIRHILT